VTAFAGLLAIIATLIRFKNQTQHLLLYEKRLPFCLLTSFCDHLKASTQCHYCHYNQQSVITTRNVHYIQQVNRGKEFDRAIYLFASDSRSISKHTLQTHTKKNTHTHNHVSYTSTLDN